MTEKKKGPEIRDFDAVSPERRYAKIGGKKIDVTFIPPRVTLDMARFKDDLEAGKISDLEKMERMVDLVARAASRSDPEVTSDWLLDNTPDIFILFEFINFVLTPTLDRAEKAAEEGNAKADSQPESS